MINFFRRFFRSSKSENRPLTEIDLALKKLKDLEPHQFQYVHSSDLSNFTIFSHFSSLNELNDFLQFCIELFKDDGYIRSFKVPTELKKINISDFFLKPGGLFADEVFMIIVFIDHAVTYLEYFKQGEKHDEVSINFHHNTMKLGLFNQQLIMLIDDFSKIRLSL